MKFILDVLAIAFVCSAISFIVFNVIVVLFITAPYGFMFAVCMVGVFWGMYRVLGWYSE